MTRRNTELRREIARTAPFARTDTDPSLKCTLCHDARRVRGEKYCRTCAAEVRDDLAVSHGDG